MTLNAHRNPGSTRRAVLRATAGAACLAGCDRGDGWHTQNVTGGLPDLAFGMTDAMTGGPTDAAAFRGKLALLYFGYLSCPDVCPTTLGNLATVLGKLGPSAEDVRVLFVTVDPERDTLPKLREYGPLFAPQVVGLRGTPDQLAMLARRYRVAYSVTEHPYEVSHSALIYVFDRGGAARLVATADTGSADINGITQDLQRLLREPPPNLWNRLTRIV